MGMCVVVAHALILPSRGVVVLFLAMEPVVGLFAVPRNESLGVLPNLGQVCRIQRVCPLLSLCFVPFGKLFVGHVVVGHAPTLAFPEPIAQIL